MIDSGNGRATLPPITDVVREIQRMATMRYREIMEGLERLDMSADKLAADRRMLNNEAAVLIGILDAAQIADEPTPSHDDTEQVERAKEDYQRTNIDHILREQRAATYTSTHATPIRHSWSGQTQLS